MRVQGDEIPLTSQEQLFLTVVEQLSRPLLQISRLAELGLTSSIADGQWQTVQAISEASLRLAESYALSMRLQGKIVPLQLESMTVSSLLYDVAQDLAPFAKQYAVALELDTGPRLLPVFADRGVLRSAMTSLGQVFVQAQAEAEREGAVRLSAHRGRYGIVAGLYGGSGQLGADSLRRAHALKGRAKQPFHRLVSGPAAGVFVADSLLENLSTRLHVARYHNLTGLATTLHPGSQLQLV